MGLFSLLFVTLHDYYAQMHLLIACHTSVCVCVRVCVCVDCKSADVRSVSVCCRQLPVAVETIRSCTWVNTERCRGKATGQSAED